MRLGTMERRRSPTRLPIVDRGLRRSRVRKRWRDTWAYLMSTPANRQWIEASLAELDRWRELRGAPPFGSGGSRDGAS